MTTDVILDDEDGNTLTLSAFVIRGEASDFILDSPGRRSSPENLRRALVHDDKDGLTINFNNDYPSGITINSVTCISPKRQLLAFQGGEEFGLEELLRGRLPRPHPIVEERNDLVIDGGITFLWDNGRAGQQKSLQLLIAELQDKIATLESRVAALVG